MSNRSPLFDIDCLSNGPRKLTLGPSVLCGRPLQCTYNLGSSPFHKHVDIFFNTCRFEFVFRGNTEDDFCENVVDQVRSIHKALLHRETIKDPDFLPNRYRTCFSFEDRRIGRESEESAHRESDEHFVYLEMT